MRWAVHGERSLYESEWMSLRLVDVEVPGGERFEHHVVRTRAAAGVVVVSDDDADRASVGRGAIEAGARQVLEETGWRPGPLRPLGSYFPNNGVADTVFHLFLATGAEHVGDPTDWSESERVAWVPVADVRDAIAGGQVGDGLSLTALCWALAFGHLG